MLRRYYFVFQLRVFIQSDSELLDLPAIVTAAFIITRLVRV